MADDLVLHPRASTTIGRMHELQPVRLVQEEFRAEVYDGAGAGRTEPEAAGAGAQQDDHPEQAARGAKTTNAMMTRATVLKSFKGS